MLMDHDVYRRALRAIVAAAYQILETWEAGDLAGRVTALGRISTDWDETLDLGVARRRARPTNARWMETDEGARPMHEDTTSVVRADVRAWALRGLDDAVEAARRLNDVTAARACADLALFAHLLVMTSLPASAEVDALLAALEERVRRLAVHRQARGHADRTTAQDHMTDVA